MSLVADYGSSDDDEEKTITKVEIKQESNLDTPALSVKEEPNIALTVQTLKKEESSIKVEPLPTPDFSSPSDTKAKKKKQKKIANPLRSGKIPSVALESSVFYSPFHNEQQMKISSLEKHVKMTDNTKGMTKINGKKICWNYRKGKCKFGHNCVFAHDSDLVNTNLKSTEPRNPAVMPYAPVAAGSSETESDSRKRKPGLAPGLIPGKRSRTMYHKQRNTEQPWLQNR